MPSQMTDKTAQMLLRATNKLCDLVDTGMGENQAGVKVARDFGLTKDQIRLVGRSYNIGVVNSDRRDGENFQIKFAVSSRVDPDAVIAEVFPSAEKVASSVDVVASVYQTKVPARDKLAQSQWKPKEYTIKRCSCGCGQKEAECEECQMTGYRRAKKKASEIASLKQHVNRCEQDAVLKVAAVKEAYRDEFKNSADYLTWVSKVAHENWGKTGRLIVNQLAERVLPKYKLAEFISRGTCPGTQPKPIDLSKGVFAAIKEAVDATRKWAQAEVEFIPKALEIRREVDAIMRETRPKLSMIVLPGMTERQVHDTIWEKKANMLTGMLGGMAMKLKDGPSPSEVDANGLLKARVQLNDPMHQSELRRLDAETMLNRLVNEDEVIASYSPEQVADAFEEISQSAPGLLDNPSLFRANLRRQLGGHLTPHDANDMVEQDQRVRATVAPPALSKEIKVI
jgi:hypothetical protein